MNPLESDCDHKWSVPHRSEYEPSLRHKHCERCGVSVAYSEKAEVIDLNKARANT